MSSRSIFATSPEADLFRLYGAAALFLSLKLFVSAYHTLPEALSLWSAWPLYCFTLIGVWIIIRGPSQISLFLAGAAALRCLISNGVPEEQLLSFPAAEWPLFVALPWFTLIGASLSGSQRHATVSSASHTFRVALLGTMSWAALHKINVDFLNAQSSCARLSERLTEWWGVPSALYAWISPEMIIIAEGGLGVLLILRPRLGVLVALAMFAHFGSIGATALATIAITMALSFLTPADRGELFKIIRDTKGWIIALCALSAWGSASLYQARWSWVQYGAFHVMVVALSFGSCALILRRGLGERARLLPCTKRGRLGMMMMICLWTFNGLTPYLGLKFQYSFAMLSNLRVDDARWNSVLFPRQMRLSAHDDHLHVEEVMYRAESGRVLRGGPLRPGLYTPIMLLAYIESAQRVNETLTANITYHGDRYTHLLSPPHELRDWLKTLPSGWHLQDRLSASGPQRCVH